MITATCTWGEGPDVFVIIRDHVVVAHEEQVLRDRFTHGAIKNGSIDLTVEQAETLGHQLLIAAAHCRELDRSAEEYFEKEKTDGNRNREEVSCKG